VTKEAGATVPNTQERTPQPAESTGPHTRERTPEPPQPAEPTARAIGDEVNRLIRLAAAWKQRVKDESWGDRVLLGRLAESGPRRATDLAADTLLDLSTVSRQIRSLVERGLVERRPDPEDGRGALLSPTALGLAAVERYRAQRDRMLAEALAAWPAEDRHALVRLLGRFNDDFAEQRVRAVCGVPPNGAHGPHPPEDTRPLPHHRRARTPGQTQENP
jgi:DNA-binding MarR family transcriptional regulator